MQPCSRWLREVTVKPVNVKKLLAALSRRLEDEYRKHKEVKGYYFCRHFQSSSSSAFRAFWAQSSGMNFQSPSALGLTVPWRRMYWSM